MLGLIRLKLDLISAVCVCVNVWCVQELEMPECGFALRSAFSHILHYAPRSFCGIEMSNPIKKPRASRLSSAERAESPSFLSASSSQLAIGKLGRCLIRGASFVICDLLFCCCFFVIHVILYMYLCRQHVASQLKWLSSEIVLFCVCVYYQNAPLKMSLGCNRKFCSLARLFNLKTWICLLLGLNAQYFHYFCSDVPYCTHSLWQMHHEIDSGAESHLANTNGHLLWFLQRFKRIRRASLKSGSDGGRSQAAAFNSRSQCYQVTKISVRPNLSRPWVDQHPLYKGSRAFIGVKTQHQILY